MHKPTEKIWDPERQRHNQKLARAASVLGVSLHEKVMPVGPAQAQASCRSMRTVRANFFARELLFTPTDHYIHQESVQKV